ncbi:MAG: double-strand break repair helicase AddA, partial [Caulobacteraceae bacterium]
AGEPIKKLGTVKLGTAIQDWLVKEQERLHAVVKLAKAARCALATVHALTLARAYAALYVYEKHVRGGLDFADLIARTWELLTVRSDAAWVLYKLDGGIDHVLVDEAQDTAPEQWAILRALTGEFFSGAGARGALDRTVFAVGDEKQSIYSFQGAAPEQFEEENEFYSDRAAEAERPFETVPLTESWRSTPQVLSFVDAAFADPETRAAVPPALGEDRVHHVARRATPGSVELWPLFKDEPREEVDAWDAPLDTPSPESARKRLARWIAETIAAMIAERQGVYDREALRATTAGDVLILVRRRDALFEEIIRALKKAGVPVAGADRLRLSDHVVFQDLMALIRFVLFPGDDLTLAALLRSPFCDLDEDSLYALAQPRGDRRLWAELGARAGEQPAWADALSFLGWAKGEAARPPFDFLARALQRLDGAGRTMRQRILTRLGPEAEDALDELLAQALAGERRGVRDLEGFAAAMAHADVEVKRELEAASGQVRVMTVHGAKGLEAPIVILPDTTGRPPPSRGGLMKTPEGGFLWAGRKGDDGEALAAARAALEAKAAAESLRLLYVALTRARDRLIVCGRISARDKGAAEGCWYDRVERAFDRPEVAERTQLASESGMEIRRFGPAPLRAEAAQAVSAPTVTLPGWTAGLASAEPASAAYASPSDMGEIGRGPAPSPLARERGLGRFRRGTLIHHLLQLRPDIPPELREDAAERLLAKEGDLDPAQRRDMADAALAVLRDPQFAEVFGPGSRAEAAVAGTAPGLPDGLAVSGRVDRMLVTPGRVLVVDFKTNRPAPARIEEADRAYLIQMAIYVAVLRAVFPGRAVEAALVWTDGPRLMPVPEAVIASSLAGLSGAVD